MKSNRFRFLSILVIVFMLASPLSALAAPAQNAATPAGSGVYIILLEGAPLASYRGGVPGLEATNPAARGENKLDAKSPASLAYLDYLAQQQAVFISMMELLLDRPVEVIYQYDAALNGMAVRITSQEAARVAAWPGVINVQAETIDYPDTDTGPTWIGADTIWDGSAVPGGVGSYGEGVIVGILDTGINSDHPSFADIGGDGYNHTNPWGAGNYVGYCVSTPSFCNDKLIGAWSYVSETVTPEDSNGHGSHTSSTAAGNFVDVSYPFPSGYVLNTTISGVAPHANIIMYDVCTASGCGSAGSTSAVNQAVLDGVDVINFSISGGENPYYSSVELAFLGATDAGVFVSTSAGNNGPTAATVAHRSPWVATVAASTHNKLYANSLVSMSGGGTPPANMNGQSISTGVGPRPIVYAGNYGDALCLNPFPAGTWTNEIVVCDRGTNARVDKGANVLAGGADGFVLANDILSGDSLVADPHYLPAIHITYDDGVILKAWLASGSGHTATITPTTSDLTPANGDIMASFSSRGPNTTFDVLKPDVTAPGVAIFAASLNGQEYTFMGGTSMSSPHNAGAGALLSAVHPEWTPSMIKSALMTTANIDNLRKEDGTTPADPFDVGAGRDDLTNAALAGFVLDETTANYQAANPSTGGDVRTLNLPSMYNSFCEGTCTWTRVVSSTQDATVTWTAGFDAPAGMTISVEPASFDLAAYATQQITITVDVSALTIGDWAFGTLTLTPSDTDIPTAHMPVAVVVQEEPNPPVISVNPTSFDTIQAVDFIQDYPLTVGNTGESDLEWDIYEENTAAGLVMVDWADDFDSYATDLSLHGVGGWKGWGNSAVGTAYTRDEQARSTPNSVEIVGASDLVHEYSGYTSGQWIYTAWQYIPTAFSGESYFILLNQYTDAGGGDGNWSTQVSFDSATNTVVNDGPAAGSLPLIKGQWVEIRVEIDLDADTQSFYYGDVLLFTGSWTGGMSGGGIANIGAVDLFANSASAVYYDDISLAAPPPPICSLPSDIPWASAAPTSGTVTAGSNATVDVTFDTNGLTIGQVYSGTLCVTSNDPVTPLVAVPLRLEISSGPPVITVDPTSIEATQAVDTSLAYPLAVGNAGEAPLYWDISEDNGGAGLAMANWYDNFDSYATDLSLHGVGGWKGWGNSAAATAYTRNTYARSAPNSVEVIGTSDLVHEYSGYTTGQWIYTAWQYIPVGATGESYFILLNQYDDAGATNNWSVQLNFNSNTNTLVNVGSSAGTLPLVKGQWMEIRLEIDLDANTQDVYYGGDLLYSGTWTEENSGGGIANIGAVDLFGNNASPVYYDDITLSEPLPPLCSLPSDIPWVSLAPTSGTIPVGGAAATVDVTVDTTGVPAGTTLNGTLCLTSNDPVTPLVTVPLTVTVVEWSVELSPASQTLTGAPGDTVTHTFTLTNTGSEIDSFGLSLDGNLWPTTVLTETGPLNPGEVIAVDVVVTIPVATGRVPVGSDTFTLTATSQSDQAATAEVEGTTVSDATPAVSVGADQSASGAPGEQVVYVFTVTNLGDYADTFELTLSGATWASGLSIATTGEILPGAMVTVTVTVDIPAGAVDGATDVVTLTATSTLDPTVSDTATATTIATVGLFRVFLPLIQKALAP